METSIHNQPANRKRRIASRLQRRNILVERKQPLFSAAGIQYEVADRVRGIAGGGIGGMQMVADSVELAENINRSVHVPKRHLPYHESDHVLNIAYNLLAGGTVCGIRLSEISHRIPSTNQWLIDEFVGYTTEEIRRRYRHLFPDVKQAAISSVFG